MREVELSAERIHRHVVHEHEREVRFAAARKHAGHGAVAAGGRNGEPGHRAQRVGDRVELPGLELGAGDHGDGRCGLRERDLDLRGRDHDRFRHGADVRAGLAEIARALPVDRREVGAETRDGTRTSNVPGVGSVDVESPRLS